MGWLKKIPAWFAKVFKKKPAGIPFYPTTNVAETVTKVGKKAFSWVSAKYAVFAGAGLVGSIYIINGGLVDLIGRSLGTSPEASQFILIFGCLIALLFVLRYVFDKVRYSSRRSFSQSFRNASYAVKPRTYNNRRYRK